MEDMELPPFTLENLRELAEEMKVYMCCKCRLPLGDSSNCCDIQSADQEILLNGVSNNVVILREKILTSYRDEHGSIYQVLQCKGCSSPIGKFFISTPTELDNQIEKFLLNAAAVTVYSFGSANKQVVKPSDMPLTLEKCHEFENEVKKCQKLLGKLQRKVDAMDSYFSY